MGTRLKLNRIKDLQDARYCSAVGVEWLSFSFLEKDEEKLKPAAVAEILNWLSGPKSVGEFDAQRPVEIIELAKQAQLQWISIPLNYPEASALPPKLIFRMENQLDKPLAVKVLAMAKQYPQACFEYSITNVENPGFQLLHDAGLSVRSLFNSSEAESVCDFLKQAEFRPLAFSLNDFVEEPDGHLDYEACDDFLEAYEALI